MKCTDQRLVSVCTTLFRFITSGKAEQDGSYGKLVARKNLKTGSISCKIDLALCQLDMIFKPMQVNPETQQSSGSNEGANVFMTMPFKDDEGKGLRIPCYYTERNGSPELICSPPDNMSQPLASGVRRVTQELRNVTTSRGF